MSSGVRRSGKIRHASLVVAPTGAFLRAKGASMALTILSLLPRALRHRVIRSRMVVEDSAIRGFQVGLAESEEDTRACANVVHDSYVERGIMDPHPSGLRVTPHLVLPTSRVFVAKSAGKVIG